MKHVFLPALLAALALTTACKKTSDSATPAPTPTPTPTSNLATAQVGGVLTAASEVPGVSTASSATGSMSGTYDPNTKVLTYTLTFSGLTGNASAGHLHFGDAKHSGPVTIPFSNVPAATSGTVTGTATLTQMQADSLTAGRLYANIHTAANAGGEIRANLVTATSPTVRVLGTLLPGNEKPAVTTASSAIGSVAGNFNPSTKVFNYTITFAGLTGNASAGHLHFGDAKHSGPVTVPFSNIPAATKGTLMGSTTLTQMQADSLLAGRIYTNIHTAANPSGEIRANLVAN